MSSLSEIKENDRFCDDHVELPDTITRRVS